MTLALTVALIAVGVVVAKHDPYEVVFTDLQAEDSKAIEKKLGELNIPFTVSEDRTSVSVPGSLVNSARMQLAKEGIPGNDVVGFEKFDGSTIGMSTYIQRIQYVRAVQGELYPIDSAPGRGQERAGSHQHSAEEDLLEEEDPPRKASVVLELKPGQDPSRSEVRGIAHLVASAVEGLKVSQVTIVDTKGNLLQRPDDETIPGVSTALLEMERSIEAEYEKRIEDILSPVVGMGKVRAKVTAEIDPSRINTTEESYDPDKAVARNVLRNDEVNQGSRPNPMGIPGSRSNLPGTEVQNPPIPMSTTSNEKNMQNTSYAIPRKVMITDKPSGSIKRLTVAVVVDGIYNKTTGAKEAFSPRSDEELKRLRDLVANSVGIDDSRRDSITISSLPFHINEFMPAEEVPAGPWYQRQEFVRPLIRNGLIGLGILLFLVFFVRPMLKWAAKPEPKQEPAVSAFPRTVAEIEAANKEEGLLALTRSTGLLEEVEPLEKKEEAELRKKSRNDSRRRRRKVSASFRTGSRKRRRFQSRWLRRAKKDRFSWFCHLIFAFCALRFESNTSEDRREYPARDDFKSQKAKVKT